MCIFLLQVSGADILWWLSQRNAQVVIIQLTKVHLRREELTAEEQGGFYRYKPLHDNLCQGLHLFSVRPQGLWGERTGPSYWWKRWCGNWETRKNCFDQCCHSYTYSSSLCHMFVWLQTAFNGYFDVPEGMEYIVKYVNQRYKNTPVYVTENGEWQWTHEFTKIEKLLVPSHLFPYIHNDHVLSSAFFQVTRSTAMTLWTNWWTTVKEWTTYRVISHVSLQQSGDVQPTTRIWNFCLVPGCLPNAFCWVLEKHDLCWVPPGSH